MEANVYEFPEEPRYSMKWLGQQSVLILISASVLAIIACGIKSLVLGYTDHEQMTADTCVTIANATTYCWGLVAITLLTISLIELKWRTPISCLQYCLAACALCLFFLMLMAFAENMPLVTAYWIVAAMIAALVTLFTKGLTGSNQAAALVLTILAAEYALLYVLVTINAMALLVGSLTLFAIIAVAMYFTIKLRVENEELILK